MSTDILGTNCDQRVCMVQCCFTSTETVKLIRTESPGRSPRPSHTSRTLSGKYGSKRVNIWSSTALKQRTRACHSFPSHLLDRSHSLDRFGKPCHAEPKQNSQLRHYKAMTQVGVLHRDINVWSRVRCARRRENIEFGGAFRSWRRHLYLRQCEYIYLSLYIYMLLSGRLGQALDIQPLP